MGAILLEFHLFSTRAKCLDTPEMSTMKTSPLTEWFYRVEPWAETGFSLDHNGSSPYWELEQTRFEASLVYLHGEFQNSQDYTEKLSRNTRKEDHKQETSPKIYSADI